MKNKILTLILLASALCPGCSGWLDVKPYDQISEEELLESEEGFQKLLNGIYIELNSDELYGSTLSVEMIEILGGEAVLPAGSVSFDYVVTLKRTDILKEQTKNLLLELRANENFIIPFTSQVQSGGDTVSAVTFKINFSDQFTAPPAGWRSLFVGPFSQQKFELICDVMEIPRADFNEVGKITDAKWLYIESRMINYVRDQEKLKAGGEPYDERAFDENGNPLQF